MTDLRYRLRALFHRGALERELDEELQFHIEREIEKRVRAGMTIDDATRTARLAFGGVERVKDESRDARGIALLDVISQDLRYAARGLRLRPGFTAAVIVTLGLGIGANAAMFGILDRLLFRAPPFLHDATAVHRVYLAITTRGKEEFDRVTEYTRFLDLKRWSSSFSQMAGFGIRPMAVGTGENAAEMTVATVSASYFSFFDAPPVLGRYFTAVEDTVPEGAPVVVLTYPVWKTKYGGRADALGSVIQVGTVRCTVIGVTPPDFVGISDDGPPPQFFMPITTFAASQAKDSYYKNYDWGWVQIIARRRPGVRVETATADLTNAYRRSYDAERAMSSALARPEIAHPRAIAAPVQVERGPKRSRDARVATWVTGVAVIVLLIACANVANLLLARALRRRREIALRLALGVTRRRLLAQLLTESLLLALLGAAAGLLVAQWGSGVLRAFLLPPGAAFGVVGDGRTLLFAGAVALVCGVLTGLVPVLAARRGDVAATLKAGGGARDGVRQRARTRTMLLVMQGALAVVLLIGAGLFLRSLRNVRGQRLGYDVDHVLYVSRNFRDVNLGDDETAALSRRLHEAAAVIPGVESASRAATVPFWNTWSQGLYVPGVDSVRKLGRFTLQSASAEFFRTMGTRIVRGRGLTAADRAGAPAVAVVSEAMARKLWPAKDAIGQCMHLITKDTLPCTTVVGIAENIKSGSLTDDSGLHYYLSIEQFKPETADLVVRTRGDAAAYVETVRHRLQELMPGSAYVTVTPMGNIIGPQERSWRAGATMFCAFSALALVLAAIGLYSVIAYDVAQRTHELGVRIALGAQAADVLRLVVGDGVRFALAGIAIGVALALASGHWVAPLLFGVSPKDPIVFGAVVATLAVVGLVASAIPAMRASRVDPNVALRSD